MGCDSEGCGNVIPSDIWTRFFCSPAQRPKNAGHLREGNEQSRALVRLERSFHVHFMFKIGIVVVMLI